MRGTGYYGTTEGQDTIEIYAVAANIDGMLSVTEVEGKNLEAKPAAELAYRELTNRLDDKNLTQDSIKEMAEFSLKGWKYFEVFHPESGYTYIAVRHVHTSYTTRRR